MRDFDSYRSLFCRLEYSVTGVGQLTRRPRLTGAMPFEPRRLVLS